QDPVLGDTGVLGQLTADVTGDPDPGTGQVAGRELISEDAVDADVHSRVAFLRTLTELMRLPWSSNCPVQGGLRSRRARSLGAISRYSACCAGSRQHIQPGVNL